MQVHPCIFKIHQNLSEDANYVDQRIKPALIRKADAGGNEGIENKKNSVQKHFSNISAGKTNLAILRLRKRILGIFDKHIKGFV